MRNRILDEMVKKIPDLATYEAACYRAMMQDVSSTTHGGSGEYMSISDIEVIVLWHVKLGIHIANSKHRLPAVAFHGITDAVNRIWDGSVRVYGGPEGVTRYVTSYIRRYVWDDILADHLMPVSRTLIRNRGEEGIPKVVNVEFPFPSLEVEKLFGIRVDRHTWELTDIFDDIGLSSLERAVLLLAYQGHTYKEMGEVLGYSTSMMGKVMGEVKTKWIAGGMRNPEERKAMPYETHAR